MNKSSSKTIYQVSELTRQIQQMLESSYRSIWVEAEISSLSKPASGHWYFSLKDNNSQIRCAMFRSRVNQNNYKAVEGDLVRVRGKVTVYAARGDMQMIIEHIEPAGAGTLQQQFEELKNKLQQEGIFAQERKQALPKLPSSIALITSPTGAAVQDVLSTLKRRFPAIPVRLYPTLVQGTEAPTQIVAALALANSSQSTKKDVIILTRGGGSMEDLWCFNDETVVRAIAASRLPVISAVGHEVDITLADFVADLRAPTPTAAAEIVTPDKHELLEQLSTYHSRLRLSKERYFSNRYQNIDWLRKRLRHPSAHIQQYQQRLSQLSTTLIRANKRQLDTKKNKAIVLQERLQQAKPNRLITEKQLAIGKLSKSLSQSMQHLLSDHHQKLKHLSAQLSTLSYERTLERGYSIIKDTTGDIITQSSHLNENDRVSIVHADGSKHAVIQQNSDD